MCPVSSVAVAKVSSSSPLRGSIRITVDTRTHQHREDTESIPAVAGMTDVELPAQLGEAR